MSDLIDNRKAYHEYHVLDKLEAGIQLTGTEVKSCRGRHITMTDAYARVDGSEVFLYNVHISPYAQGNRENHEPKRPRKLLLHKSEIRKLAVTTKQRGLTLIPLAFYLKKGRFKVLLGTCKGKTGADKRESLKKRDIQKELRKVVRR